MEGTEMVIVLVLGLVLVGIVMVMVLVLGSVVVGAIVVCEIDCSVSDVTVEWLGDVGDLRNLSSMALTRRSA